MSERHATAVRTAAGRIRRIAPSVALSALFALLLWGATAAGAVPIPGTPVPITLQTFVVMLAGLMLTPRQAAGSVAMYLAAGAAGLPVFAGGMSTAALVGPAGGFLIGFLPGVVVTALLRGHAAADGASGSRRAGVRVLLDAARYLLAAIVGCIGVVYLFGITMQSVLTGVPVVTVAVASAGFIVGDLVKATVAALAAAGLARLR